MNGGYGNCMTPVYDSVIVILTAGTLISAVSPSILP